MTSPFVIIIWGCNNNFNKLATSCGFERVRDNLLLLVIYRRTTSIFSCLIIIHPPWTFPSIQAFWWSQQKKQFQMQRTSFCAREPCLRYDLLLLSSRKSGCTLRERKGISTGTITSAASSETTFPLLAFLPSEWNRVSTQRPLFFSCYAPPFISLLPSASSHIFHIFMSLGPHTLKIAVAGLVVCIIKWKNGTRLWMWGSWLDVRPKGRVELSHHRF